MDHVLINDLVDYIPSRKMATKLSDYNWYKDCISYMISQGIDDPHIKGTNNDGAKVHPILAMAIITHFRLEEVMFVLYNLLKEAGIEPLNFIIDSIPESNELLSNGDSYIYIVKDEVTELTKIGMTSNPKRRLKELDTGTGVRLSYVLCEFVQNCSTLENKLHNIYKDKRTTGEWFKLTNNDIDDISKEVDNWCLQPHQGNSSGIPSKFCHRICEHCGRQFGVFFGDIIRGKGMFCDNACAAQHRKTFKLEKTCKMCNAPFKTIVQSKEFCSTECERLYGTIDPSYKVNLTTVAPIGNGSRISHRVCHLCHRIISLQDDKISTGQGVYCSKSCARISRSKTRYNVTCENCGITFSTINKDMKYCSIECEIIKTGTCISYALSDDIKQLIYDYIPFVMHPDKVKALNIPKYRNKICESCGKAFTVDEYEIRRHGTMFCSRECQFGHMNTKQSKTKVCKTCGVLFKTILDSDYCSETCKNFLQ